MEVPVLTAVIGVTGTLLGTIVGGCLSTFTNFLVQKRREQAEFRIGCRLVGGDLAECAGFIGSVVEDKRWWWSLEIEEPGVKSWEEHQHVLASYLSYEAWDDVRTAVRLVHLAHQLSVYPRATKQELMDDADSERLAGYVKHMQKALARLEPYVNKR